MYLSIHTFVVLPSVLFQRINFSLVISRWFKTCRYIPWWQTSEM